MENDKTLLESILQHAVLESRCNLYFTHEKVSLINVNTFCLLCNECIKLNCRFIRQLLSFLPRNTGEIWLLPSQKNFKNTERFS